MQFHYPLSPTADFKAYSRGARRVAPRRPRDVAAPHNPSRGGVEDTLLLPGSSHRRRRCCRRVCGRLTAVVLRASLGASAAVLSTGARAARAFAASVIGSLPAAVKVSFSRLLLMGNAGVSDSADPLAHSHPSHPGKCGLPPISSSSPSPVRSWGTTSTLSGDLDQLPYRPHPCPSPPSPIRTWGRRWRSVRPPRWPSGSR